MVEVRGAEWERSPTAITSPEASEIERRGSKGSIQPAPGVRGPSIHGFKRPRPPCAPCSGAASAPAATSAHSVLVTVSQTLPQTAVPVPSALRQALDARGDFSPGEAHGAHTNAGPSASGTGHLAGRRPAGPGTRPHGCRAAAVTSDSRRSKM